MRGHRRPPIREAEIITLAAPEQMQAPLTLESSKKMQGGSVVAVEVVAVLTAAWIIGVMVEIASIVGLPVLVGTYEL